VAQPPSSQAVSEMDSIFARIRKSPRKAAVEARKNMKEQAADAYESESEFDGDSKQEERQSNWSRSLVKTTVTLIPTPGFRQVSTRSSSRLASRS
jgi:hypothetical protein